jgi:hypothetical protein
VAGADAAGADLDALDAAVSEGLYLLKIRMPGSLGFIVGMAHVIPEARAFAAYFTYSRHTINPPELFEAYIYSTMKFDVQEKFMGD